jgi:two-component SAPR family response regulator
MTTIPKEILIEDLWPEEKPKRAENNFKTTLQRLRISLEPTHPNDFGSSYIHLHDNQILLDNELCQVDINQFLALIKKGEELEKRDEEKKALSFFIEASEIYKGDFLGEDLYSPWAENKREELRNKYIELLHQTAHLHDRQGSFKKAVDCFKKVIQADPLLEESYQKLMTLYSLKGLHNEALKTYEACKKVLMKELKTHPDATTDAIYNKILEKTGTSRTTKRKASSDRKSVRKNVGG